MGAPIARNLATAGLETVVWNRTSERAEELAGDVGEIAESPADAVREADAVVTMLAEGEAVAEVMVDGGALETMRDDAVWAQMSTVGIEAIEQLATLARERGVEFVDAPVLGTKQPAEEGKLIVLAAGPAEALERLRPALDAISSAVVALGEVGDGTRMKLVLNSWLLTLVSGLAETMAFAERIGADPRRLLEIIEGGAIDSPYAQLKGAAMLKREFPVAFPARLAGKDAGLVLDAAHDAGADMTVVEAARRLFDETADAGHADEDMAAAFLARAP
jgi:3-hydroxyisobutyrate dehydrogenase